MFLVDPTPGTRTHLFDGLPEWWPIVVLLFFDPNVVEAAIEKAYKDGATINGRDYLRKLIQVFIKQM